MREVFSILIDNAIRYNMDGGEIIAHTKPAGGFIELTISNTGLVLSDSDRQRIFKQSFFRGKEAKQVNPTGMGVGLLVAKTIIEAHGGSIKLESTNDKRTTVLVTLKIAG